MADAMLGKQLVKIQKSIKGAVSSSSVPVHHVSDLVEHLLHQRRNWAHRWTRTPDSSATAYLQL